MNFDDLMQEQKDKAMACKSVDEIIELAKSEGVELTDDMLEAISGGGVWDDFPSCPQACNIVL